MRNIVLKSFTSFEDAVYWMENEFLFLRDFDKETDIRAEISMIDGNYRVGVITNTSQLEMEV